mmetsp:Transcript_29096/g.82009  ORF Transcript_29096/g.82009 Transcript_29096/m.82009 type:complete len:109 (+) Transcript_29096:1254-1580(+)
MGVVKESLIRGRPSRSPPCTARVPAAMPPCPFTSGRRDSCSVLAAWTRLWLLRATAEMWVATDRRPAEALDARPEQDLNPFVEVRLPLTTLELAMLLILPELTPAILK